MASSAQDAGEAGAWRETPAAVALALRNTRIRAHTLVRAQQGKTTVATHDRFKEANRGAVLAAATVHAPELPRQQRWTGRVHERLQ